MPSRSVFVVDGALN